jgi:hypothetical protein
LFGLRDRVKSFLTSFRKISPKTTMVEVEGWVFQLRWYTGYFRTMNLTVLVGSRSAHYQVIDMTDCTASNGTIYDAVDAYRCRRTWWGHKTANNDSVRGIDGILKTAFRSQGLQLTYNQARLLDGCRIALVKTQPWNLWGVKSNAPSGINMHMQIQQWYIRRT